MEKRDKNGMSEAEFLASYNADKYPKPSLTADMVLIALSDKGKELLLIERGGHPFLGCRALPGGFANSGEEIEKTAARELYEETSIENICFEPIGLFTKPGRDPRGWVVSETFVAVADKSDLNATAGDDAAGADWFLLDIAREGNCGVLTLSSEKEKIFEKEKISVVFEVSERDSLFGKRRDFIVKDDGGLAFDHALVILKALDMLGMIR